MKTPGERLKKIRHMFGLTQAKFAEKLGLKWDKIKDIETGRHKLRPEIALKIEKVYGVSADWLLNGDGEIFTKEDVIDNEIMNFLKNDNFINIPLIDIVLTDDDKFNIIQKKFLKFSHNLLKFLDIKQTNNIYLVLAKEEAMKPIIENDDLILIDTNDKNLIPGKIYAVKVDKYILFRKIFFDFSDSIILRSENKNEFEDITLSKKDFLNNYLLGRIKWIGKKI